MKKKLLIVLLLLIMVLALGLTLVAWFWRDDLRLWLETQFTEEETKPLPETYQGRYRLIEEAEMWWMYQPVTDGALQKSIIDTSNYDFIIVPPEQVAVFDKPYLVDLREEGVDEVTGYINSESLGVLINKSQYNTLQEDKNPVLKSHVAVVSVDSIQEVDEPAVPFLKNLILSDSRETKSLALSVENVVCAKELSGCFKNDQFLEQLQKIQRYQQDFRNVKYLIQLECASCQDTSYQWFTQWPRWQRAQSFIDEDSDIPIVQWSVEYPNSVMNQSAYSLQYWEDSVGDQNSIYKSGIIGSTNTGESFLPLLAPDSDEFVFEVKVWHAVGNERIRLHDEYVGDFKHKFSLPDISEQSTNRLEQKAWIPEWGMPAAIQSLQDNPEYWDELNPVWYIPQKDGTIKPTAVTNDEEFIKITDQHGIRVVPTLTSFDPDLLSSILNDHLDRHVEELVTVVDKYGYDGLDIDYESTYLSDKDLLIDFIRKLAAELHERNKTLSFTALSKWSDEDIYSFLPETHQVQDWETIGGIVDEFRIMAYDYTSQGSVRPGPLSPILWNKAILEYAVAKVPREKIYLALPLYSHSWPFPQSAMCPNSAEDPTGDKNTQSAYTNKKQTVSLTHQQIVSLSESVNSLRTVTDEWNMEKVTTYEYEDKQWTMYYLDQDMIKKRQRLAAHYGVGGVAYWRLGGERLD